MHATIQPTRPTTIHDSRKGEHLSDDETALLIRTGFAFDALLILIGLISILTGHIAGGLGAVVVGVAALAAGWVVVELSDHFRR
jgi:hypothetical protein